MQLLSTLRGSAHRVDEPGHLGLLVNHLGLHHLLPYVSLRKMGTVNFNSPRLSVIRSRAWE